MTESETRHTNHKSERIDKMENINVMEIVLYEIDIIAKEQLMIVKYNNELDGVCQKQWEIANIYRGQRQSSP